MSDTDLEKQIEDKQKKRKKKRKNKKKKRYQFSIEHRYYPEEVLIDRVQRGVYNWVDYVVHYSAEWHEEFISFCREQGIAMTNETALAYIAYREDILEEGMENGDA